MARRAQPQGQVYRALALKLVPFRESDLILHLFTDGLGKVAALARGGRQSRKRMGGALQPFVLLQVGLAAPRSGDLYELLWAEPQRSYPRLSRSARDLGRAGYLCELYEVLTRERDPHAGLLELLDQALALLGDERLDAALLLRLFEVRLLDALGLWAQVQACLRCGRALAVAEAVSPHPEAEGLLCCDCAPPLWPGGLWRWLVPLDLDVALTQTISHDEAARLGRYSHTLIRALHPAPLRSVEFLRQLEAG